MPEQLRLKKPIGPNHVVDPDDTVRTKSALARFGVLEVPEEGITPWPDIPMITAIADLQRAIGLPADGVINPGGPTEEAINAAMATGSDLGVIPGTEPTKPRTGVEAFDPALSDRAHPEARINIPVGPPGGIPGPQGPNFHDVIDRGVYADQANATLSAGGGHFGITPNPDPTKRKRGVGHEIAARSDSEGAQSPEQEVEFVPGERRPRTLGELWEVLKEAAAKTGRDIGRVPDPDQPIVIRDGFWISPEADDLVERIERAGPEELQVLHNEIRETFPKDARARNCFHAVLEEVVADGKLEDGARKVLYHCADFRGISGRGVRDATAGKKKPSTSQLPARQHKPRRDGGGLGGGR